MSQRAGDRIAADEAEVEAPIVQAAGDVVAAEVSQPKFHLGELPLQRAQPRHDEPMDEAVAGTDRELDRLIRACSPEIAQGPQSAPHDGGELLALVGQAQCFSMTQKERSAEEGLEFLDLPAELALSHRIVPDRPVRFNRKYHFARPSNPELDRLLDLHFGVGHLTSAQKRLCHDQQLSGAHAAELKRTAVTLAHKCGKQETDVFDEAVRIVARHFGGKVKRIGFRAE